MIPQQQRDHLIKRLKALRDRPAHVNNNEEACSSEQDGLDGSFDIVDDEESEEAQFNTLLPGSFESSNNTTARPSIMSSRVSTDEFGALSAGMFTLFRCVTRSRSSTMGGVCGCSFDTFPADTFAYILLRYIHWLIDATTISRSSSWKDKLASVFGGASTSSSAGGMSTSSSSDSLSSIRTARGGGDNNNARASSSTSAESSLSSQQHTSTSSHNNVFSAPSTSTLNIQYAAPALAPPTPAAPAFRIVEDSFIQANSTYPDCSFVPRSSFEGDSIDLGNAVVWPPPPGVILISPRQSPNKAANGNVISSSRIPTSAQKKRYLDDVEEDYDEDEDGGRYGSIRLIPKMQLESVTASSSSTTPGRRIAQMPKRMSVIASSPPRFDLEAPPLPSFATVAHQAIEQDRQSQFTKPHSFEQQDEMMQDTSTDTVTMLEEGQAEGGKTRSSSDTLEAPSQQQQPFIFGSPRQQPLTNDSFMKRIDGFAIAKQLEELQRRTGTTTTSSSSMGLNGGNAGGSQKGFMPRTASNGNLQGGNNNVRFDDKHQKEFKM